MYIHTYVCVYICISVYMLALRRYMSSQLFLELAGWPWVSFLNSPGLHWCLYKPVTSKMPSGIILSSTPSPPKWEKDTFLVRIFGGFYLFSIGFFFNGLSYSQKSVFISLLILIPLAMKMTAMNVEMHLLRVETRHSNSPPNWGIQ